MELLCLTENSRGTLGVVPYFLWIYLWLFVISLSSNVFFSFLFHTNKLCWELSRHPTLEISRNRIYIVFLSMLSAPLCVFFPTWHFLWPLCLHSTWFCTKQKHNINTSSSAINHKQGCAQGGQRNCRVRVSPLSLDRSQSKTRLNSRCCQ